MARAGWSTTRHDLSQIKWGSPINYLSNPLQSNPGFGTIRLAPKSFAKFVNEPVHGILKGDCLHRSRGKCCRDRVDERAGAPRRNTRVEGARVLVVGSQKPSLSVRHDKKQTLSAGQVETDQGDRHKNVCAGADRPRFPAIIEPLRTHYFDTIWHDDQHLLDVQGSTSLAN